MTCSYLAVKYSFARWPPGNGYFPMVSLQPVVCRSSLPRVGTTSDSTGTHYLQIVDKHLLRTASTPPHWQSIDRP